MIADNWQNDSKVLDLVREVVGNRLWNNDQFRELFTIIADTYAKEVPETVGGKVTMGWVNQVRGEIKGYRKSERQSGAWCDLSARARWVAAAGQAVVAMHGHYAAMQADHGGFEELL